MLFIVLFAEKLALRLWMQIHGNATILNVELNGVKLDVQKAVRNTFSGYDPTVMLIKKTLINYPNAILSSKRIAYSTAI